MEFLPAIRPGLSRESFLNELKSSIETATGNLQNEAIKKYKIPENFIEIVKKK